MVTICRALLAYTRANGNGSVRIASDDGRIAAIENIADKLAAGLARVRA